jgi:hypothetical protein
MIADKQYVFSLPGQSIWPAEHCQCCQLAASAISGHFFACDGFKSPVAAYLSRFVVAGVGEIEHAIGSNYQSIGHVDAGGHYHFIVRRNVRRTATYDGCDDSITFDATRHVIGPIHKVEIPMLAGRWHRNLVPDPPRGSRHWQR